MVEQAMQQLDRQEKITGIPHCALLWAWNYNVETPGKCLEALKLKAQKDELIKKDQWLAGVSVYCAPPVGLEPIDPSLPTCFNP